ncbi:MAG: hypothetical protein CM15mP12_6070 [Gammaproteobacteria bacterium]|nr:MAG: hypothetical protein CM15mP12_6070 [Gammaproteobacteria bacterium]
MRKDLKLNLPHTKIPMKAALNQREPEFMQIWKDRKVYQKIRQHKKSKEKISLARWTSLCKWSNSLGSCCK